MNLTNIANIRLITQQISGTKFKSAQGIVEWMGAMQAQDYRMAKWAIGIRSLNATEKKIDGSIDAGEIIRTHVLRPTWHLVSSTDIYWMLALTAPRIKAAQKSREKQLELTEKIFTKSNAVIEKALRDGNHLTRTELVSELGKANIATDNNRSAHLLFNAELEGIICSGISKENQTTYALLRERVPDKKILNKEEALAKLAQRYFESHCPASLQDFAWWSGLSAADAKHALEMIKPHFIAEKIDSQIYWFPNAFSISKNYKESLYLLPAFDEFIISYKDRTAALVFEHHKKAVSNNGIFWPTIVINGQVRGIWKRATTKNKTILETKFFEPPHKTLKLLIEKASEKYSFFLNKKLELAHG